MKVGPDDVEWVVRRVHRMVSRLLGLEGLLDEDVGDGVEADVWSTSPGTSCVRPSRPSG